MKRVKRLNHVYSLHHQSSSTPYPIRPGAQHGFVSSMKQDHNETMCKVSPECPLYCNPVLGYWRLNLDIQLCSLIICSMWWRLLRSFLGIELVSGCIKKWHGTLTFTLFGWWIDCKSVNMIQCLILQRYTCGLIDIY